MIDKIIFLPYAGGSKYAYRSFLKFLPRGVKAVTPELPGHGSKIDEAPLQSLEQLILNVYEQVKLELNGNYIIYGHSMGSLLGYLLARLILSKNDKPPVFLAFTGCRAPSMIEKRNRKLHLLDSESFWNAIFDFGGLPVEILENEDLRGMIEVPFRADFKMVETYKHVAYPIDLPILVINGKSENITEEEVSGWHSDSSSTVVLKKIEGDHFFIVGQEKQILEEIFFFHDNLIPSIQ